MKQTPPPELRALRSPDDRSRWLWLGLFALLLHVPVLYVLGSIGDDPRPVRVLEMTPGHDAELRMESDALVVALRLDLPADAPLPNLLGAQLWYRPPLRDAYWEQVAFGEHGEAPGDIELSTLRKPGAYEVRLIAEGPLAIVGGEFVFDGERKESAPLPGPDPNGDTDAPLRPRAISGNGEPGGDFVARFFVADLPPEPELVAMNLVEETPPAPVEQQETGGLPAPPVPEPPAPKLTEEPPEAPPRTDPRPSKRASKRDAAPQVQPPTDAAPRELELELPKPDAPAAPDKKAEIQDLFQMEAGDLDGIIGDEADRMAAALADERARSGPLAGWEEELERTKGTFMGSGPKVRPGNQQLVSTHRAEVWAYIAAMHKIVHRQWADSYLIGLDTRGYLPTNKLMDPNLQTTLELEIDESGEVSDVQIVKTSGLQTYDAEAIRIAWEAGPREPVPETMLSPNKKAYLHWSFHRDQRQCGTFGVELFVLNEDGTRDELSVDQKKIEAEEERIGVRNGGGVASTPKEPTPGTRHTVPANIAGDDDDDGARSTPGDGAGGTESGTAARGADEDDEKSADDDDAPKRQRRKRRIR